MFGQKNRWVLPLAFVTTIALPACSDTEDPEIEPEIESMRILVTPTGGTQQTITVARNGCTRTGNPITLPINNTSTVSISFLNAAGQPDAIANDADVFTVAGTSPSQGATPAAEPAPTPSTIVWTRTGNFAGTLRGSAATTTGSVTFSALHIEEGHADFECAVAITVQ